MDEQRRLSFGGIAEVYDRSRPSYPAELVDDLIAAAGRPGCALRAMEVGAGTGKATELFAARGVRIDAIEPSAGMAAVARANLAGAAGVRIIEAEFEALADPDEPYPLLYCAQAWHWIDPATRYAHARRQLCEGGRFAAFWNRPVWDGQGALGDALAEVYRSIVPELTPDGGPMVPGARESRPKASVDWEREIAATPLFDDAELRSYQWEVGYSASGYTELLRTHSDHNVLPEATRARLLDGVAAAIDAAGGELRLGYVTRLCLARAI